MALKDPEPWTVARIAYFKRYRMEIVLNDLPEPRLPLGFAWVAWSPALLAAHAETLFECFRDEIDARVFASLGDRDGCQYLMTEISRKQGFAPLATWLIAGPSGFVGTIQGIRERTGQGAIQNVGIVPTYRGLGLGKALVLQALQGFRYMGLGKACLEVTAQNEPAVQLYRRLGLRRTKTIYKAVPDLNAW